MTATQRNPGCADPADLLLAIIEIRGELAHDGGRSREANPMSDLEYRLAWWAGWDAAEATARIHERLEPRGQMVTAYGVVRAAQDAFTALHPEVSLDLTTEAVDSAFRRLCATGQIEVKASLEGCRLGRSHWLGKYR